MKRNTIASASIFLMVAAFGLACAGPSAERSSEPQEPAETARAKAPAGPFEAAERWASAYDTESTSEEVAELVSSWKSAHVERVWAAGEQYRAVVVQKSTTGETPAVLLVIARGDDDRWQVVDQQPTTSTHLWSEL